MIADFSTNKNDIVFMLDVMREKTIVCTSGFFDPIHPGHIRNIQESSRMGDYMVVIVNGDNQAKLKKGKSFMPAYERAKIVDAIRGVNMVVIYDSEVTTDSIEPLQIIMPDIFTKGGDRKSDLDVPESDICQRIGCEIVYNVGNGSYKESSSDYLKSWSEFCNGS